MSSAAAAVGLAVVLAQVGSQLAPAPGPAPVAAPAQGPVLSGPLALVNLPPDRDIDFFAGLFAPQAPAGPVHPGPGRPPAPEATPVPDQAPGVRVVCGMMIVTPDPRVDPRMPRLTPSADVAYTIRATSPPVCRD
jgi:hypothetical protein